MERSNKTSKWMTLSGLAEDYPTWSTRFSAFGPPRRLTDAVELSDRAAPLREAANDAQTRELEAQIQIRATAVQEDESRKNLVCCYLATTLDASGLMLIRRWSQEAWRILQQRFRSDETTAVICLVRHGWPTSSGQNHLPVHHQSARTGHPLASCW